MKITDKRFQLKAVGLIILLGVWLGGKQAARRQPTDALRPVPEHEAWIRNADGVDSAMLSPEYWISRGTPPLDSVLMTSEEKDAFNAANKSMLITESGTAMVLTDIGDELNGDFVKEMAATVYTPKPSEFVYLNGVPVEAAYWAGLKRSLLLNGVPKTVSVRFGYSVFWTTLQAYPTRDVICEKGELFLNKLVRSNCYPCQPLAVVHESADGRWYYVLTDHCGGWLEKEYVALCRNREEWIRRMKPENRLVVTGAELCLADDPSCRELSGARFPMGTALPLVSPQEAPESLRNRTGPGCYTVRLPLRDADGRIRDEYAFVPFSADVHVGGLEFTAGAVLRQTFKLLGRRYGWGGDGHANDCSGTLRDVFSCFGVILPRTSKRQAEAAGFTSVHLSALTDDAKLALLKKTRAGSLLFFPGHAMLYLGTVGEEPYVISAAASFYEEGEKLRSANTVAVNSLKRTYRKDGGSWLSHLAVLTSID